MKTSGVRPNVLVWADEDGDQIIVASDGDRWLIGTASRHDKSMIPDHQAVVTPADLRRIAATMEAAGR